MVIRVTNSGFSDWTPDNLPTLTGRTYFITGGNSGIGFAASDILARAGANVIVGARSPEKGRIAAETLSDAAPGQIDHITFDLTDMRSVRRAAKDVTERYERLDALVCNAGVMQTPQSLTRDGVELQFAINHLSHFLLCRLLSKQIERASGRFVTVSSIRHKAGAIDFDDLMLKRRYTPSRSYERSQLANLLFAFELHRRLTRAGSPAISVACHPGYVSTQHQNLAPDRVWRLYYSFAGAVMAQSLWRGAFPTVLAAAGREALAGGYYGPQDLGERRGRISDATVSSRALDETAAARLWREDEQLADVEWGRWSPAPEQPNAVDLRPNTNEDSERANVARL